MLRLKCRLPFNSSELLVATGIVTRREPKRNSSLTIQTLNPLVKEVEYAVRGKNLFFFVVVGLNHDILFHIDIIGPIVIRAGEIENQLKVIRCLSSIVFH